MPPDWPPPPPEALAHGRRVAAAVGAAIEASGGALPFSAYMELVLHAPGLGYYSAGARKFGPAGDFVTAPELTSLFGQCLANTLAPVVAATGGDVLEIGPGSGRLALDLLQALDALGAPPRRYCLLEPSAELRERQRTLLQERLSPALRARLEWLEGWPASFVGAVVANEVLDAFPVERFRVGAEGIEQACVVQAEGGWRLCFRPAGGRVAAGGRRLAARYRLPPGFVGEWSPALPGWMAGLARALHRGVVVLVDYGLPGPELYRAERTGGSLRCHYRHRVHDEPLLLPGLQDLTADVDFTAVAEAAQRAGLQVAAFVTQAAFLIDAGIEAAFTALAREGPGPGLWQTAQAVRTLLLPGEMGERFQVMGLAKGWEAALPGFRGRSRVEKLAIEEEP
ncbi:MAG: hypothetical protein D6721_03255 [Gammaproteobacteria bacterium]|nr:MAG: hypothetical protein D6721_03255 [Gammaproteobacteria bacterium]